MANSALEKAIKLQRAWTGLAKAKRAALAALEEEHRQRRADVKEALHEAIRELFRAGMPVAEVSNVTGNTNYSLLYKLKNDAGTPARVVVDLELADLEETEEILPDIEWEHHDHIGVHGWLLSDDGQYVKFYGQPGTTHEGDWAIVELEDRVFVAGSLELNNAVSNAEFNKKVKMLTELIDGTYTGPTRVSTNPYTD